MLESLSHLAFLALSYLENISESNHFLPFLLLTRLVQAILISCLNFCSQPPNRFPCFYVSSLTVFFSMTTRSYHSLFKTLLSLWAQRAFQKPGIPTLSIPPLLLNLSTTLLPCLFLFIGTSFLRAFKLSVSQSFDHFFPKVFSWLTPVSFKYLLFKCFPKGLPYYFTILFKASLPSL